MTDLRIMIHSVEAQNHAIAPEGAGWYITATRGTEAGTEEVVPSVRLSSKEILNLGKIIDKFITGKPLNWRPGVRRADVSLEQAVIEANEDLAATVRAELARAELAIKRLEQLRARASEFGIDD